MAELKKIDGFARTIRQILSREKFEIDVYQREYKWRTEHVSTMIDDLSSKFLSFYDPKHERSEVNKYPPYFLGSFVINQKGSRFIVDGQQRLTTLSLLLIYIRNYAKSNNIQITNVDDLIFSESFGKKSFNINIPDRTSIMNSIFQESQIEGVDDLLESQRNLIDRFKDIQDNFPEELKEQNALMFFVDWLIEKVIMVEIIAYDDDDSYTIFETMNDRGLSLNSTDMLKGYLLANIRDEEIRKKINDVWKKQITKLIEFDKEEGINFFKNWFRAKYANEIRESKKGATNKDFEKIDKYHRWVRDEKVRLGLSDSRYFAQFANEKFIYFSAIYLKVLKAKYDFDANLKYIFYNSYDSFAFQDMILLSAIKYEDSEEIIAKKIALVSYFIEIYIVMRRINSRSLGYSGIKYTIFTSIIKKIRDKEFIQIKDILKDFIMNMDEHWEGFDDFILGSQDKSFVKFLLARITQYIEEQIGINSSVKNYMDVSQKTPFEIEHLIPNKYSEYNKLFKDEKEFDEYRNKIGALILLPKGFNQSFNADRYEDKIKHYGGQNILARSLNPLCYDKNPLFLSYIKEKNLPFKDYPIMDKSVIEARTELYKKICQQIWNVENFDMI